MIPRVGREGETLPATRATRAQVARTGTRTAGVGEQNIHHADCTSVRIHVHTGDIPVNMIRHTSLNTHTGTVEQGAGADGTTAPGLPKYPVWLSHTRQYTLIFLLLSQKVSEQRVTSIPHQIEYPSNERAC